MSWSWKEDDFDPQACHQQKSQDVVATDHDYHFKLGDVFIDWRILWMGSNFESKT